MPALVNRSTVFTSIFWLVVLLLIILYWPNPQSPAPQPEPKPEPVCSCWTSLPPPYAVNMTYKDHKGDHQDFVILQVADQVRDVPKEIWELRLSYPFKTEYVYALDWRKDTTGLLWVRDVKQGEVRYDYVSLRVRLVPCQAAPLSPADETRQKKQDEWQKARVTCPVHGLVERHP